MNVESYRRRAALNRKRGPGRPPAHATIKESAWWVTRRGNQIKALRRDVVSTPTQLNRQ
jgi:hypothetical protein